MPNGSSLIIFIMEKGAPRKRDVAIKYRRHDDFPIYDLLSVRKAKDLVAVEAAIVGEAHVPMSM